MSHDLNKLLERLIEKKGGRVTEEILSRYLLDDNEQILTVVISEDTHHIPNDIIRGEKYVVIQGSLKTDNDHTLRIQVENCLKKLVDKLKEKKWNKIYLIPSGFPELCIMTKLLIYRVNRIDSIDIMYVGNGRYSELSLNSREIAGASPTAD